MHQPQVEIEIVRGQARELARKVDRSAFLIGSARDCDLVLATPGFPEVHAYLVLYNDGVALRYLGNKPAMTVNNRLVRNERLYDGDRIMTGPYEFVMRINASRPSSHHLSPVSIEDFAAVNKDFR